MGYNGPAIGADGANNGYTTLHTKFTALQKAAAGLMEEAELVAQRMRANADASVTVADLCAGADVDPVHVAAIADIGEAFGRTVGGCKQLLAAADFVHQAAGHLKTQHQAEYGGIHAAAAASRARQARPGFYQLP
jgi:hypothetical protein